MNPKKHAQKETGLVTGLLCRHIFLDEQGQEYSVKRPIDGKAFLGRHGIEGQQEKEYYDDCENALLHYAYDHYEYWRQMLPESEQLLHHPGAFSENISALGMTEHTVCIGDIFRIGQAEVQVSYGREACHTMNERFGKPDMAREMHKHSRNGWFYRVLNEGHTQAGDTIVLLERLRPDWTLARIQDFLFGKSMERQTLQVPSRLLELAAAWKNIFAKRLETGKPEENAY